ncbi:MAG: hypothetical protein ABSF70_10745 [Terracidiphilus sp.]|jgi:hypothetical protein
MAVLSVDLAIRRWSDLGIVVLSHIPPAQPPNRWEAGGHGLPLKPPFTLQSNPQTSEGHITCETILWSDPGPVDVNILAGRLNQLCVTRNIRVLMLDGPQAWKSGSNGLEHSRVSERQLNTAAKTGLPGMVKPLTYRPFAEFCLDVYDALCRRGWRRLDTRDQPTPTQEQNQERVLVESYPHAAWKSLGLKPLPSKRKARVSDLAEAFGALRSLIPLNVDRPPNHDQLQAIVGGLPGLALEERNATGARIVGTAPRREEGHWREGFIVLPLPPNKTLGLRWLH